MAAGPRSQPNGSSEAPTRWSRKAARASATMWAASLQALPSTPSPTGTPAARMAPSGAMPLASRMLLWGQWATPVPVAPKRAMPAASSFTQCACQTSSPTQPRSSAYSAGVRPNRSRE